jgi:hypothetical protein
MCCQIKSAMHAMKKSSMSPEITFSDAYRRKIELSVIESQVRLAFETGKNESYRNHWY